MKERIITYGNTTHFCLHVAEQLEKERGWKVEVIDIRSLIPLDKEAIFESVKKTSKALVVHEDKVFSGFGAELAAMIGTDIPLSGWSGAACRFYVYSRRFQSDSGKRDIAG